MKKIFSLLILISVFTRAKGLLISEVMSNPIGDDSGREWIEIYNNTDSSIDLSSLTVSIKGANPIAVTPLSGGIILNSGNYAIIASVVSGATKFLQDYPNYSGPLFKSSISLVNTGVTSIDLKLSGNNVDSLSSYTAAKEGYTLSLVNGNFVQGNPTPGFVNEATSEASPNNISTSSDQVTVPKQSAPSPDIVLYMPAEKTVVAGAETTFSTHGMTRDGKNIEGLNFIWAFGDGGQGVGSSTVYKYAYPGRYVASVEANNSYISGSGIIRVRVVSPDIVISKIDTGKYGAYIDLFNPNNYDLDMSQWKLLIDNKSYSFPKNTIISKGETTHLSGLAMGFASTTISEISVVKILFPSLEEVAFYKPNKVNILGTTTVQNLNKSNNYLKIKQSNKVESFKNLIDSASSSNLQSLNTSPKKDTRFMSFIKLLFSKI